MRKIEHFKSMIKVMKDKKLASANELVNDIADPNSTPEASKDQIPAIKQPVLNKAKGGQPFPKEGGAHRQGQIGHDKSRYGNEKGVNPVSAAATMGKPFDQGTSTQRFAGKEGAKKKLQELKEMPKPNLTKADGSNSNKAPNTWFHYDHPEHGKIEVAAHVPANASKGGVKIHSVGAPNDVHIHPDEAGITATDHELNMKVMARKLGPGQHMKKSEEMMKAENPHSAGDSDKEVEHVVGHDDFQAEHQHRGHAIQVSKHPETGTYVAHIHDLRHPDADTGGGHLDSTKPHATHEAAHKAGKQWINHHLKDEFKKSENQEETMSKSEYTAEEIVLEALKKVKEKQDLKKAEEMKRDEGKAEDTGSIYNEEQEVGNQNDIQEAAKRDTARLNGKKLKEFLEKQKNKAEKAAKSPIKEEK
jgi:hypothetical protein